MTSCTFMRFQDGLDYDGFNMFVYLVERMWGFRSFPQDFIFVKSETFHTWILRKEVPKVKPCLPTSKSIKNIIPAVWLYFNLFLGSCQWTWKIEVGKFLERFVWFLLGESFSGTEGYKSGVVFGIGSMFFSTTISGSKSGHLGLLKRGFRIEGVAKNNFSQKLELSWSEGPFFMILGGLRNNLHDFWCLGEKLEIIEFSLLPIGGLEMSR